MPNGNNVIPLNSGGTNESPTLHSASGNWTSTNPDFPNLSQEKVIPNDNIIHSMFSLLRL